MAVAAAGAFSLTSCGEDEPATTTSSASQELTRPDLAQIEEAKLAVERYCIRAANRFRETGAAPPAAEYERAIAALDRLSELAREKPSASGPAGDSPRFALGDIAESLEGTNCDSRLVRHIDEELATIPPQ